MSVAPSNTQRMERTALDVTSLCVRRGTREILRDVSLAVPGGEICALMGVSGSGKSTMLRSVAALQPFDGGAIRVGGESLGPGALPAERKLRALRRTVGMVFQAHTLFEHLTVLENVTLAPIHALGWTRDQADTVAMTLLDSLGVSHRAQALPRALSGGEAQRVAIARALAPDPQLLLMDEPTSALDPARRGTLGETLRALAREGRALLIATHDVDFARAHTDRVAVLSHGTLVELGVSEQVLTNPQHAATRELLAAPRAS